MASYLALRATQKERVRILYRRALKDTLNWAVHRHLFYHDADALRERFETNKNVAQLGLFSGQEIGYVTSYAPPTSLSDHPNSLFVKKGVAWNGSPPWREDDKDGHYVFAIGDNLTSHYKICSKMGEGTFGQVLECWYREKNEIVAIKIVRGIKKYRDAAMIEVEVLQQLGRHDKGGNSLRNSRVRVRLQFRLTTEVFLKVLKLEQYFGSRMMPDGDAKARVPGTKLAASYINFYIANKAIITTQFGDQKWDDEAVRVLSLAFPDYEELVRFYSVEATFIASRNNNQLKSTL